MNKTLLPMLLVIFLLCACAPTPKATVSNRNVFYAGGENGVKTALLKAGYTLVDDFDVAEVFVLNGEIPSPYTLHFKVRSGAGLILIPGKHTQCYGAKMDVEALIGQPLASFPTSRDAVNLEVDDFLGKDDPLITEIDWDTAPQIRKRAWLSGPGPAKVFVRVRGYAPSVLEEIPDKVFYLGVYLDDQHNVEFQEWEYFDYLIYHLVERAAGAEPLSYADYSAQTR